MLTPRRIGFVSTRFAGTDGVSLETRKWAEVLTRLGHTCSFLAGESDYPAERSRVVPEAHFMHPEILATFTTAFAERTRPPALTAQIQTLAARLKQALYEWARDFDIELVIIENALTIPLNIPLGIALTEYLAETGKPAIAHHHDFFWERKRFLVSCIWDYLDGSFPPHLPNLRHVVINSLAAEELSLRNHIFSLLVPNVMDFEHPPAPPDEYVSDLRAELGIAPGERFILQPTRIIPRKGIEHAVELVGRLGHPARLVISHSGGDEGEAYVKRVREYAELLHVPVQFAAERVGPERGFTADGRRIYSIADVYQEADLVTYPSSLEGFGNAFLEAVYFRRPLVVNNYSVFQADIKPRGFRVIEFDGFITDHTIAQARAVLENRTLAQEMTELNYAIAVRYFSYAVLTRRLETLLAEAFGE